MLPILQRELLVQARRPAMHWGRLALAGFFALMVSQHFIGTWMMNDPVQAGRSAFDSSLGLSFVLACAACLVTTDAFSGERREGTLGLLLLTPMTVLSVVLGKLASSGLTVLLALLGLIPALMIPVLAGGVSAGEAIRSGLALLATATLALAVGLWSSAVESERARAVRRSVVAMLCLVIVPLPVGWGWRQAGISSFFPGPLDALWAASGTTYPMAHGRYWLDLLAQLAGAGLFLWLARARLRREACDEIPGPELPPKRNSAPALGEGNPLIWRVCRTRGLRMSLWVAAVLMSLGGGSTLTQFLFRSLGTSVPSLVYFTGQWGGLALAAWAASRFFIEANRSGELELLRTTPLGARWIITAHRSAFASALRGPVVFLVGWSVLKTVVVLLGVGGGWGGAPFVSLFYLTLMPLVMDLLRLLLAVWLGTLLGLKLRRQAAAVMLTVAVVELLPMLAQMLLVLLLSVVLPMSSTRSVALNQAAWALGYLVAQPLLLAALAVWARSALSRLARLSGDPKQALRTPAQRLKSAYATFQRLRHWTPA